MFGVGFGSNIGDAYVTTMTLLGLGDYTNGLQRASRAWDNLERSQRRAGSAPVMAGAGLDTSGLDKFTRIGTGVGVGLTAAVSGPLLGLLGKSGKLGMAAVESENLVAVTFGKMTEDVNKWSRASSKALGFNEYELRRQAGVFSNLFTGAGFDSRKATTMAKELTDAKNDMVSFFNIANDNDAVRDLMSGLSGEIEPLRKFGIFMTENTLKQYAWSKGIATAGKELSEQEKVAARYGFIMDNFRRRQVIGDAQRTKDSPANMLRRQRSELDMELTKLGMSLMPITKELLDMTGQVIPPIRALVDEFAKLSPAAQKSFLAIALGAGPVILGTAKLVELVKVVKMATTAKRALEVATNADIVAEQIKARVAIAESGALSTLARSATGATGAVTGLRAAQVAIAGGTALGTELALGAGVGAGGAVAAKALLGRGGDFGGGIPMPPNAVPMPGPGGFNAAPRSLPALPPAGGFPPSSPGGSGPRVPRAPRVPGAPGVPGSPPEMGWFARWWAVNQYRPVNWRGEATSLGSLVGNNRVLQGASSFMNSPAFGFAKNRAIPVVGNFWAGKVAREDYRSIGWGEGSSTAMGVGVGAGKMGLAFAAMNPAWLAAAPALGWAAPAFLAAGAVAYGANVNSKYNENAALGRYWNGRGKRTREGYQGRGIFRAVEDARGLKSGTDLVFEAQTRMVDVTERERQQREIESRNASGGTKSWRRFVNLFKTGFDVSLADKMAEEEIREWWGWRAESENVRLTALNQRRAANRALKESEKRLAQENAENELAQRVAAGAPAELERRRKAFAQAGLDYDAWLTEQGTITNRKPKPGEKGTPGYNATLARFGYEPPKEQGGNLEENVRRDLYMPGVPNSPLAGKLNKNRDGSRDIIIKLPPNPTDDELRSAIHSQMSGMILRGETL